MSRSSVRNRLLAALTPDDFALLEPMLKRVTLEFGSVLIEAHHPIRQVFFPESGAVSVIADAIEGRIKISLIGREGFVGIPVVLGTDQVPRSPCSAAILPEHMIRRLATWSSGEACRACTTSPSASPSATANDVGSCKLGRMRTFAP